MGNVVTLRPKVPETPEAARVVARLSTAQLKALWDSDDIGDYAVEAIHAEMNRRGEGLYVAV